MAVFLYSTVRDLVEADLDIQGDDIISPAQLMEFFNSAIRGAAAIIHDLFEGYFLTSDYLDLVQGQDVYDLPDDIYAFKIVKCYFDDGSNKYELVRIKLDAIVDVNDSDEYRWNPEANTAGAMPSFVLYPTPRDSLTDVVRRWYIRVPKVITAASDSIDIPQFIDYIKMHVKAECGPILGHPLMGWFAAERDRLEQMMRSTLKTMVLDGASEMVMDKSFYMESEAADGGE